MMTRTILAAAALSFVLAGCALDEGADPVDPQTATDTQALSAVQYRTIATGLSHSCALQWNGQVACWGRNNFGQLGNGTKTDSATPVIVAGLTGVTSVTAGRYHSCAITGTGEAYCWGYGAFGQLGNGSTASQTRPVKVSGLTDAVDISAGGYHTCAVTGSYGGIECWGYNAYGELGDSTNTQSTTPRKVGGWLCLLGGCSFLEFDNAVEVETGLYSTCALVNNGRVGCWGENNYGQLGDGTTYNRNFSRYVDNITDAADVTMGDFHACAVLTSGAARCWGLNNYGQLADGQTGNALKPKTMVTDYGVPIINATKVAAGTYHTCALVGGQVYCAGRNREGQLGRDYSVQGNSSHMIATGINAFEVDTGGYHTCVRTGALKVLCFGSDSYGQLGPFALSPASPDLSIVSVMGRAGVVGRGDANVSQVDVELRMTTGASLSRVRLGGVDLGTSSAAEDGAPSYEVLDRTSNGDGTTELTVRIHDDAATFDASAPVEIAVANSSGHEAAVHVDAATTFDQPDPTAAPAMEDVR